MSLSPILLFVYNRPEIAKRTLQALSNNTLANLSELYIYCDGPKNCSDEVELLKIKNTRIVIKEKKWCKENYIIESNINKGLANSIIEGVSLVIKKHGRVIVLEDDIYTSKYFLSYMNEALVKYQSQKEVYVISGYNYPIAVKDYRASFFSPALSCHGWATWERAWEKFEINPQDYKNLENDEVMRNAFDLDGSYPYFNMLKLQMEDNIDSWAIKWWWTVFKNKGLSLYPSKTLVANIGFNEDAVHTKKKFINYNKYFSIENKIDFFPDQAIIDQKKYSQQKDYLKLLIKHLSNRPLIPRILKFSFRILKKIISKKIKQNISCNKVWYGSDYGGFYVYPDIINIDSIVYSFGIGEDISFDKAIIENHKCKVFAFDPTPKSINWLKNQKLSEKFIFFECGLSKENGFVNFYLPKNHSHVSGSYILQTNVDLNDSIKVEMKTIDRIAIELQHKTIDILKIDIEGAEYDVIEYIINCNTIVINQLLVEFHDRFFNSRSPKSHRIIKLLNNNGYKIFGISKSGEEISFIKKTLIKK